MKSLNFLVFLLIAFSLIIVIGVGHGIAPIVFFEFILIPSLFNGLASAIGDNYLVAFTAAGLIGHICLGISIISKKTKAKLYLILSGSVLLLSFVLYFVFGFSENATPTLTLILSIPVILNILVIFYYVFSHKLYNAIIKI